MWWKFSNIYLTFTHSHNVFYVFGGSVSVGRCAFLFWGKDKQLNNCFWKIPVPLKRAWLVRLVRANPLIWADSAGWKVLTVHDEWKMALVTMLVEIDRVKMAVVHRSADTVAYLE